MHVVFVQSTDLLADLDLVPAPYHLNPSTVAADSVRNPRSGG